MVPEIGVGPYIAMRMVQLVTDKAASGTVRVLAGSPRLSRRW